MEDELNLEDAAEIASNTIDSISETGNLELKYTQPEVVEPEVVEHKYAAPYNSEIGKSSVDLTNKEAQEQMSKEYNAWFQHGLSFGTVDEAKKVERDRMKNAWYQKYHGMDASAYKEIKDGQPKKTMYGYDANLQGFGDQLDTLKQGLSIPGLGVADFAMDAVGLFPGGDKLDDKWDQATKLDNPIHQAIRSVASVVIPSIMTGGATNSILGTVGVNKLPFFAKHLTRLGAWTLESQIIAGISDTSEDHNAAKVVSYLVP